MNTKPDLVPKQKLATGNRIPKHSETTKPGTDKITSAKIKIAQPSKKSRTSNREEILRSGRDMAAEFAAAATDNPVPGDSENFEASEDD